MALVTSVRSPAPLLAILLFLAGACSASRGVGTKPDGGHGTDASSCGECCTDADPQPLVCCGFGPPFHGYSCAEELGPAACTSGAWTCSNWANAFDGPLGGCPGICHEVDGGVRDASTCQGRPAECCGQQNGCSHDFGPGVCVSNNWTCPNGGSSSVACDGLCTGVADSGSDGKDGKDGEAHDATNEGG